MDGVCVVGGVESVRVFTVCVGGVRGVDGVSGVGGVSSAGGLCNVG